MNVNKDDMMKKNSRKATKVSLVYRKRGYLRTVEYRAKPLKENDQLITLDYAA